MKKLKLILLGLLALFLITGCRTRNQDESKSTSKIKVVTTFYPMYDFTKKIVGDQGSVSLLITGETEPHDYEPSAKDIAKIQDADVFIYHSHEMESWVKAVLDSIDTDETEVIEASEGIELLELAEAEHEGHSHPHGVDPHLWLDPVLAQQEVATIRDGLILVDNENGAVYENNSQQFMQQLANLDQMFKSTFESAVQRDFVTQHAAFGYLAARYDLHQVAISGISPDQEPNPSELARIEDFVKEHKIDVIYTEELSSDKIASTIAKGTGASLYTLNTLEGLSKEEQDAGRDYLSVMEENLAALQQGIK